MKRSEEAKPTLLRLCLIITIILTVICVGSLILGILLRNAVYDSLTSISDATDLTQRHHSYVRAINLNPTAPEAYSKLLEIYALDGTFTKEENQSFLGLYNTNRTALNKKGRTFYRLHYLAGMLYVNGYEDENTTTRLRMALPFFESAKSSADRGAEGLDTVQIYCRIGHYYRDYIWDVSASTKEIPESELNEIIAEICNVLDALKASDAPDALYNRIGFSLSVCNLLYSQRNVLANTVAYDSIISILDSIYDGLPNAETIQKTQLQKMLTTLESNEQTYRTMVSRAYGREGGA